MLVGSVSEVAVFFKDMIFHSSDSSGKRKVPRNFFGSKWRRAGMPLLLIVFLICSYLYFYYYRNDSRDLSKCLLDSQQLHFNVTSLAILCHMNTLQQKYDLYSSDPLCLWNPIRQLCSHTSFTEMEETSPKMDNMVVLRDDASGASYPEEWAFNSVKVKVVSASFHDWIEGTDAHKSVLEDSLNMHIQVQSVLILDLPFTDLFYKNLSSLYSHFDDTKRLVDTLLPIIQKTGSVLLVSSSTLRTRNMDDEKREINILREYLLLKHLLHDHHIVYMPFTSSQSQLRDYVAFIREHRIKQTTGKSLSEKCAPLLNSRKYSAECMPRPSHVMEFLVTGLGGAGTHEITNTLQSMSIKALHESVLSTSWYSPPLKLDGSVCWFYAVNDVFSGMEYPHHAKMDGSLEQHGFLNPRFNTIIHVIRNPLEHVSSFTSHLTQSYHFVFTEMMIQKSGKDMKEKLGKAFSLSKRCPRGDACNLLMAMIAWVLWNKHVNSQADYVFRIDSNKESREMYALLCRLTHCDYNSQKQVRKVVGSTAHKVHREYRYGDLLAEDELVGEEIRSMAIKYKYSV